VTPNQQIKDETPDKENTMDRNLVTVSKFLAKHLRHAPEALGLTLQPGGWVTVDDLLIASERAGFAISYDTLIECVETNDVCHSASSG
jgi:putative RNA 2'-phosphotransferase